MMRTLCGPALAAILIAACNSGPAVIPPNSNGPFFGNLVLTASPSGYSVEANFTSGQFAASNACPGEQAGNCCIYSEPQLSISKGDPEPSTFSAGFVAVFDGDSSIGVFNFCGFGYRPFSSADNPTLQWSPGDLLGVAATGSSVSAFSVAIDAPPAFSTVTPALSLGNTTVVHLSDDLVVGWVPPANANGEVKIELFDINGVFVECRGADAAASLTFPRSTFAWFSSADTGTMTISRAKTVTSTSGNATVNLTAVANVSGNITFLP